MNNNKDIDTSFNHTNSSKDYFDFYIFLLKIFAFWKTILLTTLVSAMLFTSIYYITENTFNVVIKIKELSDSENTIDFQLPDSRLKKFLDSGKMENFVGQQDGFSSKDLIKIFIDNLRIGNSIIITANKLKNDDNLINSYTFLKNNIQIKPENGYFNIIFLSKDKSEGINILKNIILDNENHIRNSLLNVLYSRSKNLEHAIKSEVFFYKQQIDLELDIVNENIALAELMKIKTPASKELKLRSEQLISSDVVGIAAFKIPLYLYGSEALNFMKSILTNRLSKQENGKPSTQYNIKFNNHFIDILKDKNTKLIKYDLNTIEVQMNKLPVYVFFLIGTLFGLFLGLLIAFFRSSKQNEINSN